MPASRVLAAAEEVVEVAAAAVVAAAVVLEAVLAAAEVELRLPQSLKLTLSAQALCGRLNP